LLESEIDDYPNLCCEISSRTVNEVLGYQIKAGIYVPTGNLHAWNYDSSFDLCISVSQFDKNLGNVYFAKNSELFYEFPDKTKMFENSSNHDFFSRYGLEREIENLKKYYSKL